MAGIDLRYDASSLTQETRNGTFIYDGTAAKFHEWEFRTMVKWQSSEEQKRL